MTAPCSAKDSSPSLAESLAPGGVAVVLTKAPLPETFSLVEKKPFTVQVLLPESTPREKVDDVRRQLAEVGTYGKSSARSMASHPLPYAENLVNAILMDDTAGKLVATKHLKECRRVLAPLGILVMEFSDTHPAPKSIEQLVKDIGLHVLECSRHRIVVKKPWPKNIDEWTHHLHGPNGNPVANDTVVGPPEHYQWISTPEWMRSHESDSSIRGVVTAGARFFCFVDEAPTSLVGPKSPPDQWSVVAQDAFNGVELWKVPIENWGWRQWKPSWFTPRPGVIPLNLDKRLVATDKHVYATLGFRAPVSRLDAETGALLKEYPQTARASEILVLEGDEHHPERLVVTVLEEGFDTARVQLIDADSGELLWTSENAYRGTTTDYYRFTAMRGKVPPADVDPTLDIATDGKIVALLDQEEVVGLDFKTGKQLWRTTFPLVPADFHAGRIDAEHKVWTGTMIVLDDVVIHASPHQLAGFSAESGKLLWTQPKQYLGHLWYEWKDVFVIDGLVWTWSAEVEKEPLLVNGKASGASRFPVAVNGYDLHTGKKVESISLGKIFKTHHHHRCYRNKATLRYILASRRGTEYVDLKEGMHTVHNWVRGTCHMGMMPANGLQYAPPHPCVCYSQEKINAMNALAPARPRGPLPTWSPKNTRLEKGPAYGKVATSAAKPSKQDWATWRGDSLRSGSVETTLPADLAKKWEVGVGGRLAAPVSAAELVFLPAIDAHQLTAFDAASGKRRWTFTAGGRIDTPPTWHEGAILFGSADGWVYCLRANDGQLVWRFRAAPLERQIGAFGQLESAWPVHGTVTVVDDIAYFAAGRCSHLDGGVMLCGIETKTGTLRHHRLLEGPDYNVENIEQNYRLPQGDLPDILQSDGEVLFMRENVYDMQLAELPRPPKEAAPRVSTTSGTFLDETYFKRLPWKLEQSGHARMIVHDRYEAFCLRMFDSLQGLNPEVYFTPGEKGYLLYSIDSGDGEKRWSHRIHLRVNSMALTDNFLLVAGAPDVVDPKDPLGAFEGRKGGRWLAIDRNSGEKVWETELESPPVYHGLIAAGGQAYLSTRDGRLLCFGKK
jgi:outer membrane protein assembly factor BamB